jgi:hypothetical protein
MTGRIADATMARLQDAVLRTLAYADVFDFAMTDQEVHRYLVGVAATGDEVCASLDALRGRVVRSDGLTALPGRAELIAERRRRRRIAARTWPVATRYARAVAALPFVRMVAVTGALAVGNAVEGADIDLLVVTRRDRVWTARAATIVLVRHAARAGHELCPNYLLAEHRLELDARDLYRAHELAQMVPVVGHALYARLRSANPWSARYLPNAGGAPAPGRLSTDPGQARPPLRLGQPATELLLRSPLGTLLERVEQGRKIPRFQAEARARGVDGEATFNADRCKGHLEGHGARIRAAYEDRIGRLGVEPLW